MRRFCATLIFILPLAVLALGMGAAPAPTRTPDRAHPIPMNLSVFTNPTDYAALIAQYYRGHYINPAPYLHLPSGKRGADSLALRWRIAGGLMTQPAQQLIFTYNGALPELNTCDDPAWVVVREDAPGTPAGWIAQAPPGVDPSCDLWRTVTYAPDGAVVLEVYSHHVP